MISDEIIETPVGGTYITFSLNNGIFNNSDLQPKFELILGRGGLDEADEYFRTIGEFRVLPSDNVAEHVSLLPNKTHIANRINEILTKLAGFINSNSTYNIMLSEQDKVYYFVVDKDDGGNECIVGLYLVTFTLILIDALANSYAKSHILDLAIKHRVVNELCLANMVIFTPKLFPSFTNPKNYSKAIVANRENNGKIILTTPQLVADEVDTYEYSVYVWYEIQFIEIYKIKFTINDLLKDFEAVNTLADFQKVINLFRELKIDINETYIVISHKAQVDGLVDYEQTGPIECISTYRQEHDSILVLKITS